MKVSNAEYVIHFDFLMRDGGVLDSGDLGDDVRNECTRDLAGKIRVKRVLVGVPINIEYLLILK